MPIISKLYGGLLKLLDRGITAPPQIVSIQDQDSTIQASTNDWATSWIDYWTPLRQSDIMANATGSGASATGSSTANASGSSGGLSTGAKFSIAVGVVGGVPALLAIGFFVFRQWRQRADETKAAEAAAFHQTSQMPQEFVKYQPPDYSNAGLAPREISNQGQI